MPFIMEGPFPLDMIASEANNQRSRDSVTITGDKLLLPGTLLAGTVTQGNVVTVPTPDGTGYYTVGQFHEATSAAEVTAILLYYADPTDAPAEGVPVRASALTRDCEVNDAYLIYGDMDRAAVANALQKQGIIIRKAVLANPATLFAQERQDWPADAFAVASLPEPPEGGGGDGGEGLAARQRAHAQRHGDTTTRERE